jgi:NADH-quinone oxidoreductase subunit N
MNLGAFFIVTLMRRDLGSVELTSLRGAAKRHPLLAICFTVILFSLTGLPPTAGFLGKFMLFEPVIRQGFYLLALAGLLNGAVSLYYYAQPLREMYLTERTDERAPTFRLAGMDTALVVGLTVPLVVLMFIGGWGLFDLAGTAVAMVK